jgi:hypothetical protein
MLDCCKWKTNYTSDATLNKVANVGSCTSLNVCRTEVPCVCQFKGNEISVYYDMPCV